MNLPRLRLPHRFAAYFEIRTRHGIVNRETGFNENDHPSDYTLIVGLFTSEQIGRNNDFIIRPDRQMSFQLFHDAQLVRDGNRLNQYDDGTFVISRNEGRHDNDYMNRNSHAMRFCVTPYTAYVDTNEPQHLPIVIFDYRTTERLMDENCSHARMSMPNRSWIRHLLLERRNLVEDTMINQNSIDDNSDLFRIRRRQWNEGQGWAGGGGGAAGGGYGAGGSGGYAGGGGGSDNYYQHIRNEIRNIYPINPISYIPNIGVTAGGAAGGGAARAQPTEQEGTGGRPLETFVAEALLREAIRTNMTCAISMEPVEHRGFVVTNCFHIFQREALEQWAESHSNCPVCRASLVYRPVNVMLPQ